MRKKYVNKLVSLLTMLAVLLSVMVFQLASAFDDVGDLFVTVELPYPIKPADGYYEKTEKAYFGDDLHYSRTHYNTFDTNGRLTAAKVVEERGEGDLLSDYTFYYSYTYDAKGNIIEENMDGNPAKYEYRSDGSHVIRVHDSLMDIDEAITFDPILNAYHYGEWKFEFDGKGRKTKMSTVDSDGMTYEKTFSYVEDSTGRITKKLYTVKENGETTNTGEVIYSYSNNGRTATMTENDAKLVFNYNSNNQIKSINYSDNYTTDDYSLTYDNHGNLTLVTGNHTSKYENDEGKWETSKYTTRYEATYETHSRGGSGLNGLVQGPDGRWAMYRNGEVDTSVTGVYQNANGWWRVEKGFVNFNANGIYQNENGWWKTTNGKVTFIETGVFQNEFGWWRVKDSKVDFTANGIYQNQHGWWKTTNGRVTFNENGVFQNENGWWKVENSKVNFKFFGIASNQNGSWFIRNGKVDFSKSGVVEISGHVYTLKDGKVVKP